MSDNIDDVRRLTRTIVDTIDYAVSVVAIVVFNHDGVILLSFTQELATVAISISQYGRFSYAPASTTSISAGLLVAQDLLSTHSLVTAAHRKTIVLLTDGDQSETHGGNAAAVATAAEVKASGIAIYAIGIGPNAQAGVMIQLASPGFFFSYHTVIIDLAIMHLRANLCRFFPPGMPPPLPPPPLPSPPPGTAIVPNPTVTGLLVGLVPLTSSLLQFPLLALLRFTSMRRMAIGSSLLNVAGCIVYSLAQPLRSGVSLFVGKILSGTACSPLLPSLYIIRRCRSRKAAQSARVALLACAAAAYVMGLSLAAANEELWDVGDNELLSSLTFPGYILASASLLLSALLAKAFVEPSEAPALRGSAAARKTSVGVVYGLLSICMTSIAFTSWLVHAAVERTTRWGWTQAQTCLYVAAVVCTSLPWFLVGPNRSTSLAALGALTLVGAVALLPYNVPIFLEIVLCSIGAILIVSSTQLRRMKVFDRIDDGTMPSRLRFVAASCSLDMMGVAIGSLLAPVMADSIGLLIIVTSSIEIGAGLLEWLLAAGR